MQDKLSKYKTFAVEFATKVKNFKTVCEIALFGSVAGGDQFPKDIDIAIFLDSLSEIPEIAKAKRRIDAKMNGLDLFVFDRNRTFIGNVCHCKECPGQSVDCNAKDCGKIQFVRKRDEFEFDPPISFKTSVEILYQSGQESILLKWQGEILKKLDKKEPIPYLVKESMFIRCRDCCKEFELNPGEQKYFESQGWQYPKRCQTCRDERKRLELDEVIAVMQEVEDKLN